MNWNFDLEIRPIDGLTPKAAFDMSDLDGTHAGMGIVASEKRADPVELDWVRLAHEASHSLRCGRSPLTLNLSLVSSTSCCQRSMDIDTHTSLEQRRQRQRAVETASEREASLQQHCNSARSLRAVETEQERKARLLQRQDRRQETAMI